jgi:hypothetical protein
MSNAIATKIVTPAELKEKHVFLLTLDVDNNFKLDMYTVDKISTFEFFHVNKLFNKDQVTRVDIYGLFNEINIILAKKRLKALLHNLDFSNAKAINTVAFFEDILENILFKTEVDLKESEINGLDYLQAKGFVFYKYCNNALAVYFNQELDAKEAENIKHSLFFNVDEEVYTRVLYHLQAA